MRKRIALIMGEIDNEYSMELVPHICEEAARSDWDVVVFCNYCTYDLNISLYSDGERSVINIPEFDSFEGVIVEETRFHVPGMDEKLYGMLRLISDEIPVVYLKSVKDGCHSIMASDRKVMKTMTEHFIHDHGFTRICHMAGRKDLDDAHERLRGYREAMEEAGLNVTENMIYWGDYWYTYAAEALDSFISPDGEYPEAIVCANDYMAISIIRELIKRGKRVPEDVCVSGYDNAEDSKICTPPLTTIEAPMKEMACQAVDLIKKVRSGIRTPQITYIEEGFEIIKRDSCGCGCHDKQGDLAAKIDFLKKHMYGMDLGVALENGLSITFDLDGVFSAADGYFGYTKADKGFLCLCDDAIEGKKRTIETMTSYTDKMILKRIYYSDTNIGYDSPEEEFDRRDILPMQYFDTDKPGLSFVFPVHALNHSLGYFVLRYTEDEWPNKFIQAYTNALGSAIDNYNIRSEYMVLEKIKKAYLMDDLTGLNNRRGFEQNLQTTIDRMRRRKLYMTLVSADMDNLKYINDTYGHSEGDFALIQVANAIGESLGDEEYAARIGGDEFAVILFSEDPERPGKFEAELNRRIARVERLAERPYPIHVSLGMSPVMKASDDPQKVMQKADEEMYRNKRHYRREHPELLVR